MEGHMQIIRLVLSGAVLPILVLGEVSAQEDHVWTEFFSDEVRSTLSYSGCSPDECFGEVVTLSFGCEETTSSGSRAVFTVIGDHTVELANKLMSSEFENHKVAMTLGRATVDGPIDGMEVFRNEMDGGWVVTLIGSYGLEQFFAALTTPNLENDVALDILGWSYDLKPNPEDAEKLAALGQECLRRLSL
jgi:hypothetical protein